MSTVQSLYDFLQYRDDINVTADDLIHIVDQAAKTIAKRLYVLGSELITHRMSISLIAGQSSCSLPSDFWGFKENPFIDGKTYPLIPLPSLDTELTYTSSGDPVYYKVRGTKLYVVPTTATAYTVKGDYFQKPTALTSSTSTLPFNELFDDVIAEYIMRFFRKGAERGIEGDRLLREFLIENVDLIVTKYDRKAPEGFPQAIQWDNL
jgi:hypothetical protein